MEMIHDIVAAKPLDGYRIDVKFDTGERGVFDCSRYLDKPYWTKLKDKDFFNLFIDRTAVYMGDFLNEKGTRAVFDPMLDLVYNELVAHKDQNKPDWAGWWWNSTNVLNDEVNKARNWLSQRTDYFYQQMADFYELDTPTPLTVNSGMTADELGSIPVTINDVPLSEGIFDGKMFANRSVTLNATPSNGKQVTGWNITTTAVMPLLTVRGVGVSSS